VSNHAIRWDSIRNIKWNSKFFGLTFIAYGGEGVAALRFRYQTIIGRIFCEPRELLLDFVAPDDDWGLVADLPSFVHSCFESNENIHERLSSLIQNI